MPRLGHKKSRLGCQQCKARHVKCDELKPCTNCARHGVPCSLVVWDPSASQSAHSASSASSASRRTNQSPLERSISGSSASSAHVAYPRNPSSAAGARAVSTISEEDSSDSQSDAYPFLTRYIHRNQPSQSSLWLRDLELLHHWTTEAFDTLSQRPTIRHMWRVEAPKQANAHDFFMHEILAFAALHKAYQQPQDQRQPYYACGIHHQDLAIRGVREKLQNVTDEDAPAIVATSTLLTFSVFASTGFEAQTPATAPINDIDSLVNAFHLMQGMGHVLALAQMAVRDSFLGPILRDPLEPTASQPVLLELQSQLPALVTFIEGRTDLSEAERKLYLTVISLFEPAFQISLPARVDNRELRFLFFWPLQLGPDFMEAIQQRRSGAIVILLYYTTMFHAAETRYWFMEGWGQRVSKACHQAIDQSWAPAIQWPLSFLEQGDSWSLFANVINRGQASGSVPASQQPSAETTPQREAPTIGSSTSGAEPSQSYSIQRRGSKYAVQMGAAEDEQVPGEDEY